LNSKRGEKDDDDDHHHQKRKKERNKEREESHRQSEKEEEFWHKLRPTVKKKNQCINSFKGEKQRKKQRKEERKEENHIQLRKQKLCVIFKSPKPPQQTAAPQKESITVTTKLYYKTQELFY
jgi:hypothetical protein